MKILAKIMFMLLLAALIITSCKKDDESKASANPTVNPMDSTQGAPGAVVTITGKGLAGIKSIVFETNSVPAPFNPVFNNDNAIVFRVPDTAYGGEQNIILTNALDVQIKVPYKVIALPSVIAASNYNFTGGTQLTLIGNNLDDVVSVTLESDNQEATIVSKKRGELVITMPNTEEINTTLTITNATGPITTSQQFVNFDKAYTMFTEDYDNGFQNASWASASISTTEAKSGSNSFKMTYPAGNWTQFGFGWSDIPKSVETEYNYLTFWIKGASKDYSLYIWSSASPGGNGTFEDYNKILVPKDVWTYFKIPLTQLKLWANGNSYNQLGWRIQGPDGADETFYLDDAAFVK
ncbi:MAG: cell shape determination protein CcmA [Sphingobacteriales bacterium]|nr:MAG: cell shape determination protein CcmA [Sphingobacteriales bacterium]